MYSMTIMDRNNVPHALNVTALRIYEKMLEVWFENTNAAWDLLETVEDTNDFSMWLYGPQVMFDMRVDWKKECGIRIKDGACLTFHQVFGRSPVTGKVLS